MFSATKFVVAGAIVALFGGFLLVWALTDSQPRNVIGGPASASLALASPHPAMIPSDQCGALRWELDPFMTGPQIEADIAAHEASDPAIGAIRREAWDGLLEDLGATPEHVSLLSGSADETEDTGRVLGGTYLAMRVEGADELALESAFIRSSQVGWTDSPVTLREDVLNDGKRLTWLRVYVPHREAYALAPVYFHGDTAYAIELNSWWTWSAFYGLPGGDRGSSEWDEVVACDDSDVSTDTSANITPDLLPGVDLVTEEVEPGVYRVVSDGIRDLSRSYEVTTGGHLDRVLPMRGSGVVVGLNDSVWAFDIDRFFRIGHETTHQWDVFPPEGPLANSSVAVGPDGTLWRAGPVEAHDETEFGEVALLRSFDGSAWDVHVPASGELGVPSVEVTTDGKVWVAGGGSITKCLGRLTGDAWEVVDTPGRCPVALGSDLAGLRIGDDRIEVLDRDEWRTIAYPPGLVMTYAITEVGPGGTVWVQDGRGTLGRFDGTAWQVYRNSDEIPSWWEPKEDDPWALEVAPDQSVWYPASGAGGVGCGGVTRFDGRSATQYLADHCVSDLDIAPDGNVWLRTILSDRIDDLTVEHVYVITPEAVAGAE